MRYLIFFFLFAIQFSCSERLFDNPYDKKVPKELWMPHDFSLKLTGSNSVELTWSQQDNRIDGFLLEKKIGGYTENIELSRYSLNYIDTKVNPNLENSDKVEYTLRASAGDEFSNSIKIESNEGFPYRITDVDGNVYETIGIGSQIWLAENLRTGKYRNGDKIDYATEVSYWAGLQSAGSAHYNFDDTYDVQYGRLYNWFAVSDNRGLCPLGWHVPTIDEWYDLANYLGGSSSAGSKLKETGTLHWSAPNEDSTDESGFTALPGGSVESDGTSKNLGNLGSWWTITESDVTGGWYASVQNNDPRFFLSRY